MVSLAASDCSEGRFTQGQPATSRPVAVLSALGRPLVTADSLGSSTSVARRLPAWLAGERCLAVTFHFQRSLPTPTI